MLKNNPEKIVKKLLTPFERFFSMQASAGIFLLFSALTALVWANSAWSEIYHNILRYPLSIHLGSFSLSYSLHHWVNDALMVIFFFVVGLEIKRELSVGELSTPKQAALPIFAALGGMVVPALIYFAFNSQGPTQVGWGIPMATDIAFAVGILSLMSNRVPLSLKIFLLALAIVDDLGAVLVIAFFYSQGIIGQYLAFAGLIVFVIFCAKKMDIKNIAFYIFCGVLLWFFILKSGVHSTVAGVILGLMCPSRFFTDRQDKLDKIRELSASIPSYKKVKKMKKLLRGFHTPTHRLIEDLHPYVSWIIMPIFAFFNAGVEFKSGFSMNEFVSHPVSLGILFGLFLGKPIGILLFSFLGVRLKLAVWPSQFNWKNLTGVGFLAGIGFTMALFISHLSFDSQPELAVYSKTSILLASLLAMVVGLSFLLFSSKNDLIEADTNTTNTEENS